MGMLSCGWNVYSTERPGTNPATDRAPHSELRVRASEPRPKGGRSGHTTPTFGRGTMLARSMPAGMKVPPYCRRETRPSQRPVVNDFPFSVTVHYSTHPSKFDLCPHLVLSGLTAYAHCSTRNLPKRNFAPRKSGVSMDHNEAPPNPEGGAGRKRERTVGDAPEAPFGATLIGTEQKAG